MSSMQETHSNGLERPLILATAALRPIVAMSPFIEVVKRLILAAAIAAKVQRQSTVPIRFAA